MIISYFIKATFVLKAIFTKKGLILVPTAVTIPLIVESEKQAIFLLLGLIIADFFTGIGASYSIRKKRKKQNLEVAKNLISSEKLRKSGVKFLVYFGSVLISYNIQKVFNIKSFDAQISDNHFSITLFLIFFWCVVEIYSILFENFKEMGFDIKNIVKKITNLYKVLKENKEEICK